MAMLLKLARMFHASRNWRDLYSIRKLWTDLQLSHEQTIDILYATSVSDSEFLDIIFDLRFSGGAIVINLMLPNMLTRSHSVII